MINMGSHFKEPALPSATLPRATPILSFSTLVYSTLTYFIIVQVSKNSYISWKLNFLRLFVGGWTNPVEKHAHQIRSFPQVEVEINRVWNHRLN